MPKKDWSLKEWIANFLQDEIFYYGDGDYEDPYNDPMPGGDSGIEGDLDDGIIESLVIVGLAAALVFLVMYRQQRQQAARRAEENIRRGQQQQQGGQDQRNIPQQQPQDGQGFFQPGAAQWGVGGVGH